MYEQQRQHSHCLRVFYADPYQRYSIHPFASDTLQFKAAYGGGERDQAFWVAEMLLNRAFLVDK
eukprot:3273346-Amphidinium_carterae.1